MKNGNLKHFQSHEGDLRLAYREWKTCEDPEKIFIYVHGIESHSGWFSNTANMLADLGYAIYAPDRRGAGMSEGLRGHMDSYDDILKDIKVLFAQLKGGYPRADIYIIGLSLGGSIAVNYSLKFPGDLKGIIMISPAIETKIDLPLLRKIKVLSSAIFIPTRLFSIPIEIDMFTRNKEFIDFIKSDPLRLTKVTAKFYLEILKMKINHLRKVRLLETPVLTLMAGKDMIIDNDGVIRWMNKLNVKSKYYIIEDAYHSLQLEKLRVKKTLIDDITGWIQEN